MGFEGRETAQKIVSDEALHGFKMVSEPIPSIQDTSTKEYLEGRGT